MDHIIAPKLSPKLPKVPESLIMAGGGVTGSEYAYAFAALGARVTILQNSGQLLPRLDPEVSDAFENHLHEKYGIEVCKGDAVKAMRQEGETVIATTAAGKEYRAEYGFIAIGRKADLSILEGSEVALDLTPRQTIRVDVYGQTSVPSIYAIGDVTGVPMMANRATLQARVAVNHLTGRETDLPPNSHYIEAAYTNPPIGQIGDMTVSEESMVVHKPLASLLKAHLLEEAEGMLKINVERKSGRILGAAGFGAHMTDLLAVFQVAMNHGLTYREITAAPFAHPSISEVISQET